MYAEVRSRRESFIVRATRGESASPLIPKRGKCIVLYGSAIPNPRRTVRCASPRSGAVTTIVHGETDLSDLYLTYGCLVTTPECGAHSALTYNQNASRPAVVTGRVSKARVVLVAMLHVPL
jgi:hypothetical protein